MSSGLRIVKEIKSSDTLVFNANMKINKFKPFYFKTWANVPALKDLTKDELNFCSTFIGSIEKQEYETAMKLALYKIREIGAELASAISKIYGIALITIDTYSVCVTKGSAFNWIDMELEIENTMYAILNPYYKLQQQEEETKKILRASKIIT